MSRTTGRTPIPVRRMGTEVIADRRTRRVRDRGSAERAAVDESSTPAEVCRTCTHCGGPVTDGSILGRSGEHYCLGKCRRYITDDEVVRTNWYPLKEGS